MVQADFQLGKSKHTARERTEAARQAEEERRVQAASDAAEFKERLNGLLTGGGIPAGSTSIGGLAFNTMAFRAGKEQAIEVDAMAGSSGRGIDHARRSVIFLQ